jgi:hypothetical protein
MPAIFQESAGRCFEAYDRMSIALPLEIHDLALQGMGASVTEAWTGSGWGALGGPFG